MVAVAAGSGRVRLEAICGVAKEALLEGKSFVLESGLDSVACRFMELSDESVLVHGMVAFVGNAGFSRPYLKRHRTHIFGEIVI